MFTVLGGERHRHILLHVLPSVVRRSGRPGPLCAIQRDWHGCIFRPHSHGQARRTPSCSTATAAPPPPPCTRQSPRANEHCGTPPAARSATAASRRGYHRGGTANDAPRAGGTGRCGDGGAAGQGGSGAGQRPGPIEEVQEEEEGRPRHRSRRRAKRGAATIHARPAVRPRAQACCFGCRAGGGGAAGGHRRRSAVCTRSSARGSATRGTGGCRGLGGAVPVRQAAGGATGGRARGEAGGGGRGGKPGGGGAAAWGGDAGGGASGGGVQGA